MIVLYVMMFGQCNVPHDVLEKDLVQSQNVLRSMEEASVARRRDDLMTEVLDVARSYAQQGSAVFPPESLDMQSANRAAHEPSWDIPAATQVSSEGLFADTETGRNPSAMFASITDLDMLMDFTKFIGDDLRTESFLFTNYG